MKEAETRNPTQKKKKLSSPQEITSKNRPATKSTQSDKNKTASSGNASTQNKSNKQTKAREIKTASKGKVSERIEPLLDKEESSGIKPTSTKTKERQIPEIIEAKNLGDYLEVMSIAVFQASVSWALVLNKWENFRYAFHNFSPEEVAKFDQTKIDELMQDTGILRSEKKIKATIENAKTMLTLQREFGSFSKYLKSFANYEQLSRDLKRRFKYFGDLSVYYFLFRVGESVPDFELWSQTIEGDHPRMREMVEKAKMNKRI